MKLRLLGAIVGVVLLVLFAHDVPLASHISRVERNRQTTILERDAYELAGHVGLVIVDGTKNLQIESNRLLDEFSRKSGATAIVVDSAGYLVASTAIGDRSGEDYSTRPEIAAALLGRFTSGMRDSITVGENLVFVAVPVHSGNNIIGVVRLTYPKSTIDARINARVRALVIAAGVSISIAVLVAILLASIIARPLTSLRVATDKLAHGDFSSQVNETGPIETRQLAHSFNLMANRVKNMLQSQRAFAGDAAHQIRTPLTALRLRLEQASDLAENSPTTSRIHIEAALNETARLTNLTEQLLRLARAEGAKLEISETDVQILCEEICTEWSFLAAEKNVTIQNQIVEKLICRTNHVALREILGNFIDNAIEHTPNGSKITVFANRTADSVTITVRDQGPGLSEAQRTRAFDRFWQGSQTHDLTTYPSGFGLGLAIASQLAVACEIQLELSPSASGTGLDAKAIIRSH